MAHRPVCRSTRSARSLQWAVTGGSEGVALQHVVVAIATVLSLAACGGGGGNEVDRELASEASENRAAADTGVFTQDEFYADAESRIGQEIRIRGQVAEVASPNTFLLHGSDPERTVPVVHDYGGGSLSPGQVVDVIGRVEAFDRAAIADQLQIELTGGSIEPGSPVIVATSVATPGGE